MYWTRHGGTHLKSQCLGDGVWWFVSLGPVCLYLRSQASQGIRFQTYYTVVVVACAHAWICVLCVPQCARRLVLSCAAGCFGEVSFTLYLPSCCREAPLCPAFYVDSRDLTQ